MPRLIAASFFLLLTGMSALFGDELLVRIPDDVARRLVTTRTDPEYPPLAKQLRLTGAVQVDVFLDTEGNVEKVQVVNGHPLLSSATVAAIKHWHFAPYQSDGKSTKVVARFNVNFHL